MYLSRTQKCVLKLQSIGLSVDDNVIGMNRITQEKVRRYGPQTQRLVL